MTNELVDVDTDAIAFVKMADDKFSLIIEDLRQLPLALSTADEVFEVIRKHGSLNTLHGEEGVPGSFILFALYQMADRGSNDLEKVIEGFIGVTRHEFADKSESELSISLLRTRLEILSRLENVITSVKANLLSAERDKLLLSSRLITDVRPVLDDNALHPSMLIINTLKLEFREGSEKRTSYIALDKQDISDLIEQLERARKKTDLITTSFRTSQTKVIE